MEAINENNKIDELKEDEKSKKNDKLKKKNLQPEQKMIKDTPFVMDETTFYRSFVNGCSSCQS